jgi:hypothetical protein
MVLHSCPKCPYSTPHSSNFKRHVDQCDPDRPPTNRKKEHKCDACGIVFAQKSGLYKHNKRFHTIKENTPEAQPSSPTIISNPVNCNINCNITNIIQVNSYSKTDITHVVQEVIRSPALAQVADIHDLLEELLIQRLYYNQATPQNHTVLGVEGHGTIMNVTNDQGKKCAIDKKKGLKTSVNHVSKIRDDLSANNIIERKELPPLAEREIEDILAAYSEQKDLMRRHERAHLNKGELPVEIIVPTHPPRFCVQSEIVDAIIEGLGDVINPYRPSVAALKPAIDLFCERYAYCDGRWFAATGWLKSGPTVSAIKDWLEYRRVHPQFRTSEDKLPKEIDGWELVADPVLIQFDVQREMHIRMENARMKLRESITADSDPTEDERIAIENMDRDAIFRISLDLIKMASR